MNKELLREYASKPELSRRGILEVILTGPLQFRAANRASDSTELAEIYQLVFNMNNEHLLRKYELMALSSAVGQPFWDEDIWTPESSLEQVLIHLNEQNVTSVAVGPTPQGERIIAFNVIRPDTERLKNSAEEREKYAQVPFEEGDVVYHINDTFKLPHVFDQSGQVVRGIGLQIRNFGIEQLLKREKDAPRVVITSTTTNPAMLEIWKQSNWVIYPIESTEKYQRYRGYVIIKP
jgi:hypothetical protein